MEFMTKKKVAETFGVTERTVDRWLHSNKLKGFKTGTSKSSKVLIEKQSVLEFIKKIKLGD